MNFIVKNLEKSKSKLFTLLFLVVMISCKRHSFTIEERFNDAKAYAQGKSPYSIKLKEVIDKYNLDDIRRKQCILFYSVFYNSKRMLLAWLADDKIPDGFEIKSEKLSFWQQYKFDIVSHKILLDDKDCSVAFHINVIFGGNQIPNGFSSDEYQVRLLDKNNKPISNWIDVKTSLTEGEKEKGGENGVMLPSSLTFVNERGRELNTVLRLRYTVKNKFKIGDLI
jgi:hypothetical protein